MSKKYLLLVSTLLFGGFILYGTNPDFKQHEALVAMTCNSNGDGENVTMCPLGYGKKTNTEFNRKEFAVYSAGILSYSTYEEKFSSFGIFGNVFLTLNEDGA
tara:strand:+ start:6226 stop:6531 length:306 start_codon:yes stop_codon:yes gene_type:complete